MSNSGKKGEAPQRKERPPQVAGQGPRLAVRIAISVVLAFHLFVMFLYPLANSRTSDSVMAVASWPGLRWYAEPLYLNHGHGFFGPDPGPSFYIDYQVFDESGEVIEEGTFPDAERDWPRLLYHRYKMLADQLEMPHPEMENRRRYLLARFAQQLIREHDGNSATVVEKVHQLVPYQAWVGDPERNVEGVAVDDKSLWEERVRVSQTKADVEAADARLLGPAEETPEPSLPPESIPGGSLQ